MQAFAVHEAVLQSWSAQSVSNKHATHVPSDVLHLGVEGVELQPASDVQPVVAGLQQTVPEAQVPVADCIPDGQELPGWQVWPTI